MDKEGLKRMDIVNQEVTKIFEAEKIKQEAEKAEKERKKQEAENKRRNETKKTL